MNKMDDLGSADSLTEHSTEPNKPNQAIIWNGWLRYSKSPLGLTRLETMERTPEEIKEIIDHEIEKVNNSKTNFEAELKNITFHSRERSKIDASKFANNWIHDMLGNINNLVYYIEIFDPNILGYRKKLYGKVLYEDGLRELKMRIDAAVRSKRFVRDEENLALIENLALRLENIRI